MGGSGQHPQGPAGIRVEDFLEEVRRLAVELHPRPGDSLRVTLDSALDSDLGLDSLARAELLLRLERTFAASLPEEVLAAAETTGDLWRALRRTGDEGQGAARAAAPVAAGLEALDDAPQAAETLLDMLDWHVRRHPQRPHVYLYGDAERAEEIGYAALAEGARRLAAGL